MPNITLPDEFDHEAQRTFNAKYIQSLEIGKRLNVTRTQICNARARGMLPNAITVSAGRQMIWERAPLEPYLQAWEANLQSHRKG